MSFIKILPVAKYPSWCRPLTAFGIAANSTCWRSSHATSIPVGPKDLSKGFGHQSFQKRMIDCQQGDLLSS
jgi:hypothetical protein